jgi:hypothetical protein
MITLLGTISVPIALIYYSIHGGVPIISLEDVRKIVLYAHLLFLGGFIAKLISKLDTNSTGRYRAGLVHEKLAGLVNKKLAEREIRDLEDYSVEQVKLFKRRFLYFWCAMFFLYLVLTLQPVFSSPPDPWLRELSLGQVMGTEAFPLFAFALNNLSLICIFSCFIVLQDPVDALHSDSNATTKPAKPAVHSSFGRPQRRRSLPRFLISASTIAKKLCAYLRQRKHIVSFIILVGILTAAFPFLAFFKVGVKTNWSEYPVVFDALSGTLNAIVMARLIARLDSKLIGLPPWLISMLYFYAGIQPLFVVFELEPENYAAIKTAVLLVVFIFKIYFFLIIAYALQTGRVFNYFFCSRVLNDCVKAVELRRQESDAPVKSWRESLFKFLGWFAMSSFVGLLLYYVMRPEKNDPTLLFSFLLKHFTWLHLLLIAVIFALVKRAQVKDKKNGFPSIKPTHYRKLFELRFMLAKPESSAKTLELLTSRTVKQFTSFLLFFRFFWASLLLLYLALFIAGQIEPINPIPLQTDPPRRGEAAFGVGWTEKSRTIPVQAGPSNRAVTMFVAGWFDPTRPLFDQNEARLRGQPVVTLEPSKPATPTQTQDSSQVVLTSRGSLEAFETVPLSISEMLAKSKFPLLYFLLNNLAVLVVFWCFTILYLPHDDPNFDEKHRLLRNYSLLVCLLLTVLPLVIIVIKSGFTSVDAQRFSTMLGAIGGTLNAVAFALLFARLDSRLIGLKSSLVWILYAYAAVQPLFVTFGQHSNLLRAIAASAILAAFMFKVCLVLMVGHVRHSGLLGYLWFFPVLHKCVDSVYGNQFEIRSYSSAPEVFSFSIFNQNVEKYRAAEMYPTRARCDAAVKTVVSQMKDRNNYLKPEPIQNTFWTQISGLMPNEILCESIALNSEDERQALIDESIEKIPSCKYARG